MFKTVTLKCASCGANLDINPEVDLFACGYCGASQTVERQGGAISLKLLTSAISKVQTGTDKTAAELAIRRLKEELVEVEESFIKIEKKHQARLQDAAQPFKIGFGALTIICVLVCLPGGFFFWFGFLLWIGLAITLLFFYNKRAEKINKFYENKKKDILKSGSQIKKRLAINKEIVDR